MAYRAGGDPDAVSIDEREIGPDAAPLPEEVAPRALVPSAREREAGAPAPHRIGPSADPVRATPTFKLRDWLRSWSPRALLAGAPAFPIVALGLFQVIQQWDDAAWGVLLPEVRAEFRLDTDFILTLNAVLGLVMLQLLGPLFGYLADRIRRVNLLRAGAIIANVSSMATGAAAGVPHLILGRVGVNVGTAVLQPTGLPLIADWYPSRTRARLLFALAVFGGVGAVAGPLLGGYLGTRYGWRVSLYGLGVVALVVTVLTFLLREPPRGYQDRLEMGADEQRARREQPPIGWREGWRTAASIRTIRRLWFVAPFSAAINFAVISFMSTYYAEEFGVGLSGRSYISALSLAVAVALLIAAGPIADRILIRSPGRFMAAMGLVFVIQAGGFLMLWFTPWLGVAVGINLVMVALNGLFLPAFYTLLTMVVPARVRGLGIATLGPWLALGAPLIAAVLALGSNTGLRPAMLLFVPMALLGSAIIGTAGAGVGRDIRASRAASMAEAEADRAREAGRAKLLVCREVDVHYDGVQILFEVDLDVAEGEIVALLGTNGAGKSTLLRAIAGVSEATGGAIFYDGRDITHNPPHATAAAGVVMLPGGRAIFPTLSVRENLRAAAWLRGETDEGVEEILGMFPALRERLDVAAGDMSGGEQQMLALGQAFLMRPRLLMIDELSLGLAPAVVAQLLDILRAIHAQGTTILLVEQSVNLALSIAERAVFMEKGEVRYDGPAAELLGRGDVVRAVFLGGAVTGADLTRPRDRRRAEETRRTVLRAEGLTVRYGGVTAIDDVSLHVDEREIVGIIGPNGAGKTTLFDALSGFASVVAGRVLLDEAEVTTLRPDERARLGLTRSFQSVRLFPTMTAREAVAVALERHLDDESALAAMTWAPKLRALERRHARRIDGLLALLGLRGHGDKFVAELSTAMRRIVDLACVTATEPKVLLLDEPSSGLAQSEAEELGPLLARLVRETGCGLAIIEHDIGLVTALSERMIAMDLGRVIAEGDPAEVVANPDVIRAALGGRDDLIRRTQSRKA